MYSDQLNNTRNLEPRQFSDNNPYQKTTKFGSFKTGNTDTSLLLQRRNSN